MIDKIFVDTNIFVYAYDLDAGIKHKIATALISDLWGTRQGVLSTQVLQEFYVTITRKVTKPIQRTQARRIVKTYTSWELVVNDPAIILQAGEIEEAYQLSFWDALIVSAAFSRSVVKILTEDLNHGQHIEGMLIHNPFQD